MKKLRYELLVNKPSYLKRLTGMDAKEFKHLVSKARSEWLRQVVRPKKVSGRAYELSDMENHILVMLIYYKFYITYDFLGMIFGVDASTANRAVMRIEPILAKISHFEKKRLSNKDDLSTIIIDVTEQRIERPVKDQKIYYSGKKKRHTIKTEIQINKHGKIISISKPYPGSMHDFKIRKEGKKLDPDSRVLADSAYQGLADIHAKAFVPYKKSKNKKLGIIKCYYNKILSRKRVKVEHKIGSIKNYRILQDRYRNKIDYYHYKTKIIAEITNIKNGF
jgi:hypothetical protein